MSFILLMVNSVQAVFLEPHTGIRTFTLNYCIGYVAMAKLAAPSGPWAEACCGWYLQPDRFSFSDMGSQISTSFFYEDNGAVPKGLNLQVNPHTHRNYSPCCSCELPTPCVLYGCINRLCATASPLAAFNCLWWHDTLITPMSSFLHLFSPPKYHHWHT